MTVRPSILRKKQRNIKLQWLGFSSKKETQTSCKFKVLYKLYPCICSFRGSRVLTESAWKNAYLVKKKIIWVLGAVIFIHIRHGKSRRLILTCITLWVKTRDMLSQGLHSSLIYAKMNMIFRPSEAPDQDEHIQSRELRTGSNAPSPTWSDDEGGKFFGSATSPSATPQDKG